VIQRQTAVRRKIATQRPWTTPPELTVVKIVQQMYWSGRDLKSAEMHVYPAPPSVKAKR
jgi:hypothetical protein